MAFGITVDFTANLVEFSKKLDQMQGSMDKFQAKAENVASKVNSSLAALGIGFSITGIAAFVKSGIDAADALNDLSDRTGIAIETLAGLDYAVKIGDTSIESFASSIQRLSVNMGKNAEEFAALGINASDPIEAFKQLADVFSSIEDPQQRAAIGAAAIGKSYAEMAPLLLQGADGIQALIDKGKEQNPVTEELARKTGEFNDKLDELNNKLQHLSINTAGPAIDVINAFANAVEFAASVTDGFSPFSWLNAGGIGMSGETEQLNYLNKEITDLTQSIEKFPTLKKNDALVEIIFGRGGLGEQQRKLEQLIAARDKLTKPEAAPDNKPKTQVDQKAVNNLLRIKDDEEGAVEKSAKKSAAAIKSYASEIDTLNKKLLETSAALEKSRPENILQLNQIGATESEKATAREKALRDKAIEFDKANKTGDVAGALRIAQERETLAFQSANQDIYAARDGELPSYKIDDAKIKYKKAIEDSKKALAKFQAAGGVDLSGDALSGADAAGINKTDSVLQKTDLQTQISDAEKLKTLLADIQKPVKINIDSNVNEQVSQVETLQKMLADINANTTISNNINTGENSVDQSLSTEVLKRGARV